MSGLLPTGFVALTTTAIQKSIEQDELALIDAGLNLSPTQPLGQLNGIFASATANLWALVQAIYAAIDPNGAVGVQLDNLCAITGVARNPATKTLVICNVTLAAGTYNAGTLVANVASQPALTFTNRDTIVSPGGAVSGVVFLATVTGPVACNATSLTVITSPVTGWTAITNPNAGTLGTAIETDTALRLRRAATLAAPTGGSVDGIRSALLQVSGVISANVVDNPNATADNFGQPGKSFQAIIWDGASPVAPNDKIAQAIWNTKPAGIQAYANALYGGAFTGNAIDAVGRTQVVAFERVVGLRVYMIVSIAVNPNVWLASTIVAQSAAVQAAIVALTTTTTASGYIVGPGATLYWRDVEAAILSVPGVFDILTFKQGLNADLSTTPVETSISGDPFHIFTIAAADIQMIVSYGSPV